MEDNFSWSAAPTCETRPLLKLDLNGGYGGAKLLDDKKEARFDKVTIEITGKTDFFILGDCLARITILNFVRWNKF